MAFYTRNLCWCLNTGDQDRPSKGEFTGIFQVVAMGDQGSVYLSPTALRSGPDNKAILALGSFCQIKRCHSLHDIMNFSTTNALPAQVCSRNVDISTQPGRPDQLPAHSTPDATRGLVPAAPQPALSCLKSKRWHSLHTLLPA